MDAIVPFLTMYAGLVMCFLAVYGLSGMAFIFYINLPYYLQRLGLR